MTDEEEVDLSVDLINQLERRINAVALAGVLVGAALYAFVHWISDEGSLPLYVVGLVSVLFGWVAVTLSTRLGRRIMADPLLRVYVALEAETWWRGVSDAMAERDADRDALIAQWIERHATDMEVEGSSPSERAEDCDCG